jgi:hypothetical protein
MQGMTKKIYQLIDCKIYREKKIILLFRPGSVNNKGNAPPRYFERESACARDELSK